MKKTTREWVAKAEADCRCVARLVGADPPLHDIVCFHCQQSAEKYLKAILEELGEPIPKTHDLERLLTQLRPHHAPLKSLRRGLLFLTEFAVDSRYPGDTTNKRKAAAAMRWTERVRAACRAILGLPA